MPKRTNDYQSLVKRIYEQIVPAGGVVTESAEVWDKEAGILREVDILVSHEYAGHEFSFVVECRDRSRKETVEWIDALVGKTKALNLAKVIAVSSSGFASSAIRKAKENGIETLTLKEAGEQDWTRYPTKPGLLVVSDEIYLIHQVFYRASDEYRRIDDLGQNCEVELDGETVGDLAGLIEYFFKERVVPGVEAYRKQHFLAIFKTKEDIGRPMLVESEHDWPKVVATDNHGNRVEITRVKYVFTGVRQSMDVHQAHYVFNKKMISVGRHRDPDGTEIDFSLIQDLGSPTLRARWTKRAGDAENA
ncbi:restriction endonuclease [Cyanobium gracile UHCC 0139]|uniref:Restriction endonuclease n=1 Tax=Cyanobium gracile UHCC 0139 TaxID=3110308 RepID=A0ABU5RTU3_9CYAN|nr:restriction endonuclease [Cyanobium gracile]MEA5391186.1 restriction endonuclease [Cyanobium gracile UHCC 0139]